MWYKIYYSQRIVHTCRTYRKKGFNRSKQEKRFYKLSKQLFQVSFAVIKLSTVFIRSWRSIFCNDLLKLEARRRVLRWNLCTFDLLINEQLREISCSLSVSQYVKMVIIRWITSTRIDGVIFPRNCHFPFGITGLIIIEDRSKHNLFLVWKICVNT